MNVLNSRVVLRERTTLDVFDLALRFLATNARPYAWLSLIVLLPIGVTGWFIAREGGWWLGWAWVISLGFLAQAPFTVLASRLVFEPTARMGETLGLALRRAPALFAARVFQIFAGSVLSFIVIPTVWVATTFYFVTEVIVLERSGPFAAGARLQRLIAGQFGAALITLILLVPLHALITTGFDAVARLTLEALFEIKPPASMFEEGGSVLALIGYLGFLPFVSTARFLAYLNLRTRREGWDIQTRFTAIAAHAMEGAAP